MKAILRGAAAAGLAMAGLGIATSASAATTDSAVAQATVLTALSVQAVAGNNVLDFGTIADGGITANATLVLDNAATPTLTCATNIICGGTPKNPTFTVGGLAGKLVGISFVRSSETLSYVGTAPTGFSSTTLTANAFNTSATGNQVTLDGSGAASFRVGGSLVVAPDTAPGTYRGSVTVSVAYN
jgi:hypothetical protein